MFLLVAFPGRALLRRRRFGGLGRIDRSLPRPSGWIAADVGFVAGFAAVATGPLLDGLAVLDPVVDPARGVAAAGCTLGITALGLIVWTQEAMGAAWRTDPAPAAAGALVTSGPFALVRHPAYVAMLATALGAAALSPGAVTLAGGALLLGALMLTARLEEAELAARYGDAYAEYRARVGRFVPGMGRAR